MYRSVRRGKLSIYLGRQGLRRIRTQYCVAQLGERPGRGLEDRKEGGRIFEEIQTGAKKKARCDV